MFAPHDPTKPRSYKNTAPTTRKRTRAAVESESGDDSSAPATPRPRGGDGDGGDAQPAKTPVLPNIQSLNLENMVKDDPTDDLTGGLRIMDLDSDEPMIIYQNEMYSCTWSSSIGSDILFMKHPPMEEDLVHKPLHTFKSWDILALGAAKLVAVPATIQRKEDVLQQTDLDVPMALVDASTPVGGDVLRQAKFLGRMADIKIQRKELVGNLKSLSESVIKQPENFDAEGRPFPKRGSRAKRTPVKGGKSTANVSGSPATPAEGE